MTKKVSYIFIIAFIGIIGVSILYSFNPEVSKFFPPCMFHYFTGFDCPGCGSQRAIHYLLHLQIKEAFLRNPLLVISIPYLITGIYFEYLGGKQRFPAARKFLFGKKAILIAFCIIVLYWIGRNIIPRI